MTNFIGGLITTNNQYLFIRPSFVAPIDVLNFDFDLVKGENTFTSLDSLSEKSSWDSTLFMVPVTFAEQRELLNFFARGPFPRMGKVRAFWCPSWINDFELAADVTLVSATQVFVKKPNFFDKVFEVDRYGFQIWCSNGDLVINKIQAYDDTTGAITLAPTTTIGRTIKTSEVLAFSLVRRCRFNSDRAPFRLKGGGIAAEVELPVSEVFNEPAFS